MDASSVLGIVVPVIFAIVGIALIWLIVELVKTVKVARKTVEDVKSQLDPTLESAQRMAADLEPSIAKVDPVVDRVTLTLDAANLEIVRLDGILEDVSGVTSTLSNTTAAIDNVANAPLNVVNNVSERMRGVFRGRHSSETSAELAQAATEVQQQELEAGEEAQEASAGGVVMDDNIAQAMDRIAEAAVEHTIADTAAPEDEPYYTYSTEAPVAEEASTPEDVPATEE